MILLVIFPLQAGDRQSFQITKAKSVCNNIIPNSTIHENNKDQKTTMHACMHACLLIYLKTIWRFTLRLTD